MLEIELRHSYLNSSGSNYLKSIYLGGGTPSLLTYDELQNVFEKISHYFLFDDKTEITLEANPDDLTSVKLSELKNTPVNRLSIGVQSFFDDDLKLMNRAHNSAQALQSIKDAANAGFRNLTADLIYALPTLTLEKWNKNLETVFSLPVNHLSCYNLTVEEGTALMLMMKKGKVVSLNEESSIEQYKHLVKTAVANGFEQYEISNFAKAGNYAIHNSSYWKGAFYLGIGPSAHSYNGVSRQWNISDNNGYIKGMIASQPDFETEVITPEKKFNEYLLTGLRTKWGIRSEFISENFGNDFLKHFEKEITHFISQHFINHQNGIYTLTESGKLLADDITSRLFII